MSEYIISVNSTVDMPKEWVLERADAIVALKYTMDGVTYEDMNGLSPKEFFVKLREGHQAVTTQANPEQVMEVWKPFLDEGKDILHIAFTSGLSGTYNSCLIAANELKEKYPDRKIIVVDDLCACLGEAVLLYYASKLKKEGKNIEEVAKWVEDNKLKVIHYVTIDDLNHLYRGGRLSKASAVLGSLVKLKPIIRVNDEGMLEVIAKERGRKKSMHKIVDMAYEKGKDFNNEVIFITHGDVLEEAEELAEMVKEKFTTSEVIINNIGTVIGSHTGPGVLAVFCIGESR
ncbi:MAG: DegV family protein [Lachnospiraceae bacterium]|jgi:DegV family protein with EDD domain|nr:DegV family protein [Lachnospiraceae bacterium]